MNIDRKVIITLVGAVLLLVTVWFSMRQQDAALAPARTG